MQQKSLHGASRLSERLYMVTDEDIYNYIKRYLLATGFVPTYREIGGVMGLKSQSSVYNHMQNLEDKGLIEHKGKAYRVVDAEISFKERSNGN